MDHQALFRQWKTGKSIAQLAIEFSCSNSAVYKAISSQRLRCILALDMRHYARPQYRRFAANKRLEQAFLQSTPTLCELKPLNGHIVQYFTDISRYPLLSSEEEYKLFDRYNYLKYRVARFQQELRKCNARTLDFAESYYVRAIEIKNVIVRSNLRLVVNISRSRSRDISWLQQFISDGNLILMKAIDGFDYRRGFKFSTYATVSIFRKLIYKPKKTVQLEAIPDLDEIASENVKLPDPDRFDIAHALLSRLQPREREIVCRRFGLNGFESSTLQDIAEVYNLSKERIRQIEKQALRMMREMISHDYARNV